MDINNGIIIGGATGYKPERVEIFLKSLNLAQFKGKVILLVYESDLAEYQRFYPSSSFGFELVYRVSRIGLARRMRWYRTFKPLINRLFERLYRTDRRKKAELLKKFAYPHVSRFFEFLACLESSPETEFAMLTDTRDVYFQQHPFRQIQKGLYLGIENPAVALKHDSYSNSWLRDVYGENVLAEISSNPICCAGVTLGDYQSVVNYLHIMLDEFLQLPYTVMAKSNYDQGIHNRLLYGNRFSRVVRCLPLNSVISTVGLFNYENLTFNSAHELLLADGSKACIVHQYDRHQDWEKEVRRKFL
ncbi:hypothetical protein CBG46_10545 [Actinobacillus succinogenes]|uniref:Uncharacterized protein n=1 Tax=Actinobacillus succinogenes (strain ATCC 55618 / DSM 22257 / CCUG 43843 / 130Z) TaxID=339671 RepID=A6VNE3_ACTSZ|nr:hypothetical protein [Actinobacillus succinogenes]ABR74490.1 hypothetical protein Asuc_1124 [Actinobacillus succinogenes 130Z]PHI41091.1 hypothetical protein CBG46_10545 [Actinobacillus succinogenes]